MNDFNSKAFRQELPLLSICPREAFSRYLTRPRGSAQQVSAPKRESIHQRFPLGRSHTLSQVVSVRELQS
jgi:hypothetical protein